MRQWGLPVHAHPPIALLATLFCEAAKQLRQDRLGSHDTVELLFKLGVAGSVVIKVMKAPQLEHGKHVVIDVLDAVLREGIASTLLVLDRHGDEVLIRAFVYHSQRNTHVA